MCVSVYGDNDMNVMQTVVFGLRIDREVGWGCMSGISFPHRTPFIVIDGTLTSQSYINEVLRPAVVSFFTAYRNVTQFQQVSSRPHSVRLTTAFWRQQGINMLPCTEFSPVLSPFEHLWDELGMAVMKCHPQSQTRRQLKKDYCR